MLWAKIATFPDTDSAVKNHCVKIVAGAITCYAQWEDVGPFHIVTTTQLNFNPRSCP